MARKTVAVIGAGISGMAAAWAASQAADVTLFEADGRPGGHSNTVDVEVGGKQVAVDTGFIVYNTACYPNLIALFDHLGVETSPTTMTFAVSLDGGGYEYAGSAKGLLGQPENLLQPAHWSLVADCLRFFREAPALIATSAHGPNHGIDQTLGDWLRERRFGDAFIDRHIRPMTAAIWSTPLGEALEFPAAAFARFFANHGLLQVRNRPQWRTVKSGSRAYVSRLLTAFAHNGGELRLSTPVTSIVRRGRQVEVTTASDNRAFDVVILATHADDTLRVLADASADERRILSAIPYTSNETILHTDVRQMPKRRHIWSAWNCVGAAKSSELCVSYHMNQLQPLDTTHDLFVTLNPVTPIDPDKILRRFSYSHPVFNSAALAAQRSLGSIQGNRGTYFAGAWSGFGFHEDGLQSGLAAAEAALDSAVARPWTVSGKNDRLAYLAATEREPRARADNHCDDKLSEAAE